MDWPSVVPMRHSVTTSVAEFCCGCDRDARYVAEHVFFSTFKIMFHVVSTFFYMFWANHLTFSLIQVFSKTNFTPYSLYSDEISWGYGLFFWQKKVNESKSTKESKKKDCNIVELFYDVSKALTHTQKDTQEYRWSVLWRMLKNENIRFFVGSMWQLLKSCSLTILYFHFSPNKKCPSPDNRTPTFFFWGGGMEWIPKLALLVNCIFLSPFVQFSLFPFGQGLKIARGGEIVAFDSMWRLQWQLRDGQTQLRDGLKLCVWRGFSTNSSRQPALWKEKLFF